MSGLRELLNAATPGPWDSTGTHVHRGQRFTATHEPIAVVHTEEVDASLIALAPRMAELLLDMADALRNEGSSRSWPLEVDVAALLARFDKLTMGDQQQ